MTLTHSSATERSSAPALTKGFAILDLIAKEPGLGFAAIRNRLGLPNSSCHHLISTLCQLGALQMQPNRGYVLGLRLFELGSIAAGQRQLEELALPALKTLAQTVQLTCHLGVMEGGEAVYLSKIEGNSRIHINTWPGKRLSLHSSSLGKVLLAWLAQTELANKLETITWERKTSDTITDPNRFQDCLQTVRQQGWALDDGEDIPNIRCVAAPVLDMKGQVIAAISAVGTVLDLDESRIESLARQVCAAAHEISLNLGHRI